MTDETKAEIVKRFAEGESFGVLAKAFGVSRNKIAGIVNRYGKPRGNSPCVGHPPGQPRRIDWDGVAALWRRGASCKDIGKAFECRPDYVRKILIKRGLITPAPRTKRVDFGVVCTLRQQGLSQEKIGKLVGCSQTYISRILSLAA